MTKYMYNKTPIKNMHAVPTVRHDSGTYLPRLAGWEHI